MSRVISLTWKRLRLESFSRTDVTVLTSVPFMIALVLESKIKEYKRMEWKHAIKT